MNIRDLEYLVAVHELKNFSKAAEQCFVSQPTLSGQLKKLEIELGASLMERSTRKVLFTNVGEEVVVEARTILQTASHIKKLANRTEDPMAGDFHVGLIPTVGPFLLPHIMPLIAQDFPQTNLYLYELQTDDLIERLLKGELDAAILAKLDWNHPVNEIDLYTEELCLANSTLHPPKTTDSKVELDVLDGESVLMLEDGHCLRDQALGVCFSAGAKEDKRFQATSLDTLLHMVATGAGMTLIPKLACAKAIEGVSYHSFKNPVPTREIVMVTRKNSARGEAYQNISSLVKSAVVINQ